MTTRHASSPLFFAARGEPYSQLRIAPRKIPRARGTPVGRNGPTGLDTSRHRGLSKPILPQVHQTQGVPRAVFIGLLRSIPGDRPFCQGDLTAHLASTVSARALGSRSADKSPAYRPSGASARALRARIPAAWTAGP